MPMGSSDLPLLFSRCRARDTAAQIGAAQPRVGSLDEASQSAHPHLETSTLPPSRTALASDELGWHRSGTAWASAGAVGPMLLLTSAQRRALDCKLSLDK